MHPVLLRRWHFSLIAAAWIASYFIARWALGSTGLSAPQRAGLALLPVPAFVAFAACVIRQVRGLDELQRRIHLEALVLAFPATLLLLMTLGLLELGGLLSPEDWSYRHVWAYLPMLYFASLAIAARRYR